MIRKNNMYIFKIMLGACILLGHIDLLRASSAQPEQLVRSPFESQLIEGLNARNCAKQYALSSIPSGITRMVGGMGVAYGLSYVYKNPDKVKSVYSQAADMATKAHAHAACMADIPKLTPVLPVALGTAMICAPSPENHLANVRDVFKNGLSLVEKQNIIQNLQKKVKQLPVTDPIRRNIEDNSIYRHLVKYVNDGKKFEQNLNYCGKHLLSAETCEKFFNFVDSIHPDQCAEHRSGQIVGAGLFGIGLAHTDPEERRNVAAIGVCAGLSANAFQSLWRSFSALRNGDTQRAKRNFKGFVWRSLGAGSAACVHSTVTPHVIRGAAEGLIRTFYAVDEACFWSTQHPRASAGIAATAVALPTLWKFRGPIGRGFSWLGNQVTMSEESCRRFEMDICQ